MDKLEMQRQVAHLEFVNDQLATELAEVDNLLRLAGFPNGIESAKRVALELLENGTDGLGLEGEF